MAKLADLLAAALALALCLIAALPAAAQTPAAGTPAAAPSPVGDWHGVLAPSPAQALRLLVHIEKKPDGSLAGAMDSVDQGGPGIALTTVTAGPGTLAFTITPIGGAFSGAWDAAAGGWVGQWTQSGQSMALTLSPGPLATTPAVAGLDGLWDGVLALNSAQLHLTLHVTSLSSGAIASLDSPDQLAMDLKVDAIHRDGDKVGFEMSALQARFAGTLSADGHTITGQWTQGPTPRPLIFTHRAPGAGPKLIRPQTPVKPYPYREEEVTFEDPAAHVRLAGTLTLPKGDGPFPAVVLVAGSGPNTRNEPILGHQLFLVIADHFTRNGIAVLRYDKRGTGSSGGDYASATTLDFAADADAASAYLRSRKEIDPRRVGLVGHSEGGLIVPIVAVKDPATAFIVMMAGPGVDGLDVLVEQGRLIAKSMGQSDAVVTDMTALRRQMFDIVRGEKDRAVASAKIKAMLAAFAKAHNQPESMYAGQADEVNTDWFRFFFDYDPAPTLRQLRCPVLAMIGSKDLQVPPDQNLPALRAALAGDRRAEVLELPSLNHLFQTAQTGAVGEYGRIEETIAPVALDTMTDWILKQAGKGGRAS